MSEFKVNDYITLKLVKDKTIIYIKDKEFQQCKYILLINPHNNEDQRYIHSIDEAKEKLSTNLEETISQETITPEDLGITPKEEFWAHSSNLQAWYENKYDSGLLHSNLAFPLLKKLVEVGDILAEKVFKKEIIRKFEESEKNLFVKTIDYLIMQKYLEYLKEEEMDAISFILRNLLYNLAKNNEYEKTLFLLEIYILNYLNKEDLKFLFENVEINFFNTILESVKNVDANTSVFAYESFLDEKVVNPLYELLREKIYQILKSNNEEYITAVIRLQLLEKLKKKDLLILCEDLNFSLLEYILHLRASDYYLFEESERWIYNFYSKISPLIKDYIRMIIKNNKFRKFESLFYNGIELKKEELASIIEDSELDTKKFLLNFIQGKTDDWIINYLGYSTLFKIRDHKETKLNTLKKKIENKIIKKIIEKVFIIDY